MYAQTRAYVFSSTTTIRSTYPIYDAISSSSNRSTASGSALCPNKNTAHCMPGARKSSFKVSMTTLTTGFSFFLFATFLLVAVGYLLFSPFFRGLFRCHPLHLPLERSILHRAQLPGDGHIPQEPGLDSGDDAGTREAEGRR